LIFKSTGAWIKSEVIVETRRSRKRAPFVRPFCLTLATSFDSVTGKIKPWLSK
jgi:hypothetical protein